MEKLSDKIFICDDGYHPEEEVVLVSDVKIFIKLLKEEINNFAIHKTGVHSGFLCSMIDKLSGFASYTEGVNNGR